MNDPIDYLEYTAFCYKFYYIFGYKISYSITNISYPTFLTHAHTWTYGHCQTSIMKLFCHNAEAAAQRCSVKKVSLEISENSQENTCARVSF